MANVGNVRTLADLERKYNLSALLGLDKNVKMNEKSIIKVSSELSNMLNTLIINLKDVLESQSEVSLWFYSGTPSNSNEPYINWNDPTEHYGDIYYDQSMGYVYQYLENGWNRSTDVTLIQAMALTNVELDTTTDHERKVYFTQPVPPYSSGDWWILEEGTLKTCQLGRTTGEYDSEDFIIASRYIPTIASTDGDIITIKHGQVIKLSDTFASFEDLATGGKTTINGANITTGEISADRIRGGKLQLGGTNNTDGYMKVVDANGNTLVTIGKDGLVLDNGTKLIGNGGVLSNLSFIGDGLSELHGDSKSAGEYYWLGFMYDDSYMTISDKYNIYIDINIPDNFTITSAFITLRHIPFKVDMQDGSIVYGYSRNIKCYASNIEGTAYISAGESSEYLAQLDGINYSEITDCFNNSSNSYTAEVPSATNLKVSQIVSKDISSKISKHGRIKIATTNSNPSSAKASFEQTGGVYAILNVYGYLS